MISKDDLFYFTTILREISVDNSSSYETFSLLKKSLREFFKLLNQSENQFFSSIFSRIVYSIDKYKIPKKTSDKIFLFRYLSNKINKNSSEEELKKAINIGFNALTELIIFFDKEQYLEINDLLATRSIENQNSLTEVKDSERKEIHDFLMIIVEHKGIGKSNSLFIQGINQLLGVVRIYLDKKWESVWKILWKPAKLYLFDLILADNLKDNVFFTTKNTIIILEPDILIDVTELSNCFLNTGFSPIPFFLRRLVPSDSSPNMIQGNLVNSIFDELIFNPEITFEEAYEIATKNKPLLIFALAKMKMDSLKEIKIWLKQNFENLKQRVFELEGDLFSIEPTFYSPYYGLQGRLDLLIEFQKDSSRKIIIELKSGKAPSTDYSLRTSDGNIIKTGLWVSHFAQTTCYNMLLDSTYPDRTGSSQILYISDSYNPFRNSPNIIQKKQEIAAGRNILIGLDKSFLEGDMSFIDDLLNKTFDNLPQFIQSDLNEFKKVLRDASELEIDYFKSFYCFILGEIYAAKVGSDDDQNNNGKATIWKDSLDEKISSMNIIPYLELDNNNSDFKKFHLTFSRPKSDNFITSIRKGDIAILYPMDFNGTTTPVNNQIIKCSIKEINSEKVIVSLRNKLIRYDYFDNHSKWIIEPDYIESTDRYLFHSIFTFISSDKEKKELLLGLRQPNVKCNEKYTFEDLTSIQNEIVSKAINSEDYFIIQGPPGTGKTSYILKTIAEYYFKNSYENILILAYTNRAVDEICSALSKIENLQFLRLGSKESSNFTDKLISCLAESMPLKDLFKRLNETRIIVSTVSSILVNPEIFNIMKFNLAIVDESSQILEPHLIGILSKVNKFILIGDEKQLPAIVLQDNNKQIVTNEKLKNINLFNFSQSLFERLLRCCITNDWTDTFGSLVEQARMHRDIQFLANSLFYSNSLRLFDESGWQNNDSTIYFIDKLNNTINNTDLGNVLLNKRIIFIESDIEKNIKKHHQEAKRISIIVDVIQSFLGENFKTESIGIITPFRAQCNEIYNNLSENQKNYITIDTVERFQGSERDIIIMSFALNYEKLLKNISSIVEINNTIIDRKLNVAITRAKKQLILLGSSQILDKSDTYSNLISHIKKHFCYISSQDFEEICK